MNELFEKARLAPRPESPAVPVPRPRPRHCPPPRIRRPPLAPGPARLFGRVQESLSLLTDLHTMPRNNVTNKVNDLVSRVRMVKVQALILNELRKDMPKMAGKERKQKELIAGLCAGPRLEPRTCRRGRRRRLTPSAPASAQRGDLLQGDEDVQHPGRYADLRPPPAPD